MSDTKQFCLQNNIVCGTMSIVWDNEAMKKSFIDMTPWKSLIKTNFKSKLNNKQNSFYILTGMINEIVVLDFDTAKAEADGKAEGDFNILFNICRSACSSVVKTPNGFHLYFKINKPIGKQTNAYVRGNKLDFFDILGDNAIITAPPSSYLKGDNQLSYKWIEGSLETMSLLPEEYYGYFAEPKKMYETGTVIVAENTEHDFHTILSNLSVKTWSNYESWRNIGLILKSFHQPEALYNQYSKIGKNYNERAVKDAYRNYHPDGSLKINTLYHYLKQDAPEVFNSLKNVNYLSRDDVLVVSHQRYATLFYRMYPTHYMYCPLTGWYSLLSNNTWCNSKEPKMIHNNLVILFISVISNYRGDIRKAMEEETDTNKKITLEDILKRLLKAELTVQSITFTKGIMGFLQELYTNEKVFSKINNNTNLIAFEDKVFDAIIGNYRDILPEDYIVITTGRKAPVLSHIIDTKLYNFLFSLFDDIETMNYVIRILAYSAFGNREHQEFYMLKGKGGNGKGKLINLLTNCFGDYVQNLPSTYITKMSDSKEGALPSLTNARFSRFLHTSELETKDVLQIGFLKLISGGDVLKVRTLHKEAVAFTPQFNLFILCNDAKMSKIDQAVIRRVRNIEFPFQFRETVLHENDRPIDKSLDDYIRTDDCINSFTSLLINTYMRDVKNAKSLNQSKNSKLATIEYIEEHNPLTQWLSENYDTKADKSEKIKPADMLQDFNNLNCNYQIKIKAFNENMCNLGFSTSKDRNGIMNYISMKRKDIE